jgi:hypothetical protein
VLSIFGVSDDFALGLGCSRDGPQDEKQRITTAISSEFLIWTMIPPSEKGVVRGIVPPEREGVNLNSIGNLAATRYRKAGLGFAVPKRPADSPTAGPDPLSFQRGRDGGRSAATEKISAFVP